MKFTLALVALLAASSAFAYDFKNMINLTTTASSFSYSEGDGKNTAKSTSNDFSFRADYAYAITERIQLGGQGSLNSGNGIDAYSLSVGGIYNFDDNLANAFYTSLYAGYYWGGSNVAEAMRGQLSIGKRFELAKWKLTSVSYSPSVDYVRYEYTDGRDYHVDSVVVRLIQFSAFF